MGRTADVYLERLKKAEAGGDPLSMAVVVYQAFRDSPQAQRLKDNGIKMNYDAAAWESIIDMAGILERRKWDDEKVKKFIEHSKELAGIE